MKTTKLFLMLLLITAFGTSDFFAQTVETNTPTTKTKRKYTKKNDASAAQVVPKNNSANPVNNSPKPKRTYTKKTDVSVTPAIPTTSTVTDNSSTKPKRSYTKKKVENPVAPTTNTMQPKTKTTPTAAPRKTTPSPTIAKQPYNPANGGTYNGHQVLIGPRGGKYYINKNGNKTYIK